MKELAKMDAQFIWGDFNAVGMHVVEEQGIVCMNMISNSVWCGVMGCKRTGRTWKAPRV